MGLRSWRYSMHVVNGEIRRMFVEPGLRDEPEGVPVDVSGAETMLDYLRGEASAV
jgi:peroxiredoxin